MARGGKRLGAGRKPAWINQPTKPVKVPEALIEDILQIARLLDKKEITLEQVLQIANSKAVQPEKNINAIATNSSEKTEQLPVNLPVSKPIEVILTSARFCCDGFNGGVS